MILSNGFVYFILILVVNISGYWMVEELKQNKQKLDKGENIFHCSQSQMVGIWLYFT